MWPFLLTLPLCRRRAGDANRCIGRALKRGQQNRRRRRLYEAKYRYRGRSPVKARARRRRPVEHGGIAPLNARSLLRDSRRRHRQRPPPTATGPAHVSSTLRSRYSTVHSDPPRAVCSCPKAKARRHCKDTSEAPGSNPARCWQPRAGVVTDLMSSALELPRRRGVGASRRPCLRRPLPSHVEAHLSNAASNPITACAAELVVRARAARR